MSAGVKLYTIINLGVSLYIFIDIYSAIVNTVDLIYLLMHRGS